MSAFTITDLEYRYKKNSTAALQSINIDLGEGQCLGLIGPNGAGKSTLLSVLSGLLKPSRGKLQFGNSNTLSISKFVQTNVALVPQEYAFYSQLSVIQNLQYFVSLCGFSRSLSQARIETVIQECQLLEVINQKATYLSGGYKRRLNLAIALLKDPQILYLDEPTVGVDPVSREAILTLLTGLKGQGKTIVYTSHLLSEVQNICDQIVMLNHGCASYLDLEQGNRCLTVEFAQAIQTDWLEQFSNLPLKIETTDNNLEVQINSIDDLQIILNILGLTQTEILNIHYDQTSLTQYYLSHMVQNVISEH